MKSVSMRRRGAGPNVPDQVLGLTATPISSSQVNLTWNPAATAQSYTIRRDGQQLVNQLSATTYSDAPLAASTTYGYKVSAVNPFGEGAPSALVTATTSPGGNVFPPSPPAITNLTATGTADPTTTLRATHTLTLATDHYAVQRRVTGTIPWTRLPALNHTGASIDITGNSPGQSVDVQIAACDATESVVLWSLTATASTQAAIPVSGLPAAPITWMTAFGGSQSGNYSSATWRQLAAKYNFVEYQFTSAIEGSMTGGQTLFTSMSDVKARAAALGNTYCNTGIYSIFERIFTAFNTFPQFNSLCATWNWLLRNSYPGGAIVTDDGGASQIVNNSIFSPRATSGIANGKNLNEYAADYLIACAINGNGAPVGEASYPMVANPAIGFIILDNQFSGPRNAGAWKETTTSFPSEFNTGPYQIAAFQQQGHAQHVNRMRLAKPGILYFGNCDQIAYAASGSSAPPIDPTYAGLYDGPFMEAPIGTVFSAYSQDTFQGLINRMIRQELLAAPGGRPVFENHTGPAPLNSSTNILWPNSQANWTNTFTCGFGTQNGWTANFWQAARFIICTGLLRNHLVAVESDSANIWFYMDEFNNGNANHFNWFGTPQGSYASAPTFALGPFGVWMMTYQNARVLVNPCGNGNVTLPSSFSGHKMAAGPLCDPAINNGAAFGTAYGAAALTMKNGDGLVVLS